MVWQASAGPLRLVPRTTPGNTPLIEGAISGTSRGRFAPAEIAVDIAPTCSRETTAMIRAQPPCDYGPGGVSLGGGG
jgi:hypothetical protein